ncbi:conserved hypothetical protein [Ricinus communis]|uniref:Reverse transcriptase zinc-binding domain-containing protein n=1 Tax=Ricinus communis TaxID=3988 RepID=B9SK52_RICCO|nr:conserved hypothetical protein [Ricinus communis]
MLNSTQTIDEHDLLLYKHVEIQLSPHNNTIQLGRKIGERELKREPSLGSGTCNPKRVLLLLWNSSNSPRHFVTGRTIFFLSLGGVAVEKDLELQNKASLARLVWRAVRDPSALWVSILWRKYFPHDDILTAGKCRRASWAWDNLFHGREVILKGMRVNIRGEANTLIWQDAWVLGIKDFKVSPRLTNRGNVLVVSDLFVEQPRSWNVNLVNELFFIESRDAILRIPIGPRKMTDRLVWQPEARR